MNKSDAELAHKRLMGIIWLVGVCFFNTVPLLVISFLANLDSVCIHKLSLESYLKDKWKIRTYVPFLESWAEASPKTFSIASGVLPPAVSGFFNFFLPIIMRWLTKVRHCVEAAELQRYWAGVI
jgi:hypothetical protein